MPLTHHLRSTLLLCGAVCGTAAATPQYKLTILDSAPSLAVAVNNAGEIVGNRTGAGSRPFAWRNGAMEALPELMDTAYAISSQGHIAGTMLVPYRWSTGRSSAVYYRGALREAPSPFTPDYSDPEDWYQASNAIGVNGSGTVLSYGETSHEGGAYLTANGATTILPLWKAGAINDAGQVAGVSGRDDWPPAQAVLYDTASGQLTRLGTLRTGSYAFSFPTDLNDMGAVVGYSYLGYGAALHIHSFLYRDGTMAPLGSLAVGNVANAINNAGTVVGNFQDGGADHAYLYQDGMQYDLATLLAGGAGWRVTRAEDISDKGWIVGQACREGGDCVAALLTPVPEPAMWAMLAVGLGLMGWRRRAAGRIVTQRAGRFATMLLCGSATCAVAAVPQFSLTVLDPAQGLAVGINNAGEIAGNRWDVMEHRAFMWHDGQIAYLPRNIDRAVAISSQGHIAGSSPTTILGGGVVMWSSGMVYYRGRASGIGEAFEPSSSGGWYRFTDAVDVNGAGAVVANTALSGHGGPFRTSGDSYTVLPMSRVTAINDHGQIVGQSAYDTGAERAVLYENGRLTVLGALPAGGAGFSAATGLNEQGAVVGYSAYGTGTRGHLHSFLYENGHMTPLGSLTVANMATAINNLGAVVGNFEVRGPGGGVEHAYLYQDGVQYDLAALVTGAAGWRVSRAQDINDRGQIVGQACDRYSECVPVLLSPVPEPAAYSALLAGLALLGWRRYREGPARLA
jgi:probable HAF family extracellular repeat protein